MERKRLWQTLRLCLIAGSRKRTRYLRDKHIFGAIGENCSIMDRKVPLYAELIRLGNNVHIASKVDFVTHDIVHVMLNGLDQKELAENSRRAIQEKVGCIRIKYNVFIGTHTVILYDVEIGSNVIIGAGSLVNKDIPDNSVVAGVPAKVIGSFDDFVSKRLQEQFLQEHRPIHQRISDLSVKYYWDQFDDRHKKG